DHDAGTGSVDRHVDLAGRALDVDAAHRGIGQLPAQELAHLMVRNQLLRELLLAGVPLGHPVAGDAEADADRIDLLAHRLILPAVADVNGDVAGALDDAVATALRAGVEALHHRRG